MSQTPDLPPERARRVGAACRRCRPRRCLRHRSRARSLPAGGIDRPVGRLHRPGHGRRRLEPAPRPAGFSPRSARPGRRPGGERPRAWAVVGGGRVARCGPGIALAYVLAVLVIGTSLTGVAAYGAAGALGL
jgi:hypothetical protein